MASINRHLPSPGSAVWRRDVSSRNGSFSGGGAGAADGNKVRHVVIRDAEIREQPSPHVVYRIDVLTEHDHWYVYHRYSQFYSLHKKLMRLHNVGRDLLPPKKMSGNLSKHLIDKRRQLLESYLQKMIHSEAQIAQSDELLEFLDVPAHDVIRVTDVLTRHLYRYGDQMLEEETPIALSVNEMYSITRRLQLPFDASNTVDTDDVAADLAHLYGFIHQLKSLRISPPPPPSSICCSNFDINPFRSLSTLKLDRIPLSQINGLVAVQQQLKKLTVHRSLHSLKELLIDAVEDKRGVVSGVGGAYWSEGTPPPSPMSDKWRLTATAKLVGSRVVVQPWHQLETLVLSHNLLTHLDDSLQVLPALKELNLSHNQLQVIQLQHLCLPSLEKLNLSHNCIYQIQDDRKVLEKITKLNLAHNRLPNLESIRAFVGVATLQLSYNLLASRSDLDRLVELRKLTNLSLAGNPISSSNACRLILLTKFLQKSKLITMDGLEVSNKEQAKIQAMKDRHGNNPDTWPITKVLIAAEQSSQSKATPPTPPSLLKAARIEPGPVHSSPKMSLSWTIHSPAGSQRRAVSQLRSSSLSSTDSPRPSLTGKEATPTRPRTKKEAMPTKPGSDPRLLTHFPKSFDHLALTQSTEERDEHAIFTRTLMSGGRHVNEGRFKRGVSPFEEDLVAGRGTGGRFTGYSTNRIRDDSLVSLPDSREDPDGQSDISSISPEAVVVRRESTPDTPMEAADTPSLCSLTPPPSTPLTANGNSFKPTVTPLMIQSALTALQRIQDKDTPISTGGTEEGGHDPIFPEAVTTALTAWISQQHNRSTGSSELQTPLLSPPPSTPQKFESESDNLSVNVSLDGPGAVGAGLSSRQGISASDLIAALSSLIGQDSTTDATSGESSGVCSVPACTPKEGFSEWLRLGIHPEEVIHALTALTISRAEQEMEGEGVVKVSTPSQRITRYQEFPPSIETADSATDLPDRAGEERRDGGREERESGLEKAMEKINADSSLNGALGTADDQKEAEEGAEIGAVKRAEIAADTCIGTEIDADKGAEIEMEKGAEKGEEFDADIEAEIAEEKGADIEAEKRADIAAVKGAEIEPEEGEGIEIDSSAKPDQSTITPDIDQTTSSESAVNDMAAPSEAILSINLLNELSFFPDPLAARRMDNNEQGGPLASPSNAGEGEGTQLPTDDQKEVEEGAEIGAQDPAPPPSSPPDSVLYLEEDVENVRALM